MHNPHVDQRPPELVAKMANIQEPKWPWHRSLPAPLSQEQKYILVEKLWNADIPSFEIARHLGIRPGDLRLVVLHLRADGVWIKERRAGRPVAGWEGRLDAVLKSSR